MLFPEKIFVKKCFALKRKNLVANKAKYTKIQNFI